MKKIRPDYGRPSAWAELVLLTLFLVFLLEQVDLPAAPLMGAIAAALFPALRDVKIRVPAALFLAAQSMLGCIVARSLSVSALRGLLDNLPLALCAVLAVVVFSLVIGWFVTMKQILPGTTGIWGTSPGAAMLMTLMCEAFGADMRLVAIMQYLRIILVAGVATLAAQMAGVAVPAAHRSFADFLFPPLDWPPFAQTLLLAAICGFGGLRLRLSGGTMLLALSAGALLQNFGLMRIETPGWIQVCTYSLIGWTIGLRFNRAAFLYAWRLMPKILFLIWLMIALSGGIAALLHFGAGIDPLSAYLAACPGGMDSVAIIAAASGADMGFVMAIQTARMAVVLLTGPPLARMATARARKRLENLADDASAGRKS
ncbi:MAG: AbrB family transcriptional regulator [Desulfovibrio sp.]|jgi:membrane AbrB-like protein|nr:AbrB family transcriptional regulator [Desulfovibrio sp.]